MTTTATHPYELSIENAGPARKRVKITVPVEAIASKLQESMGVLRTQTAIPGFRKGKVPAIQTLHAAASTESIQS